MNQGTASLAITDSQRVALLKAKELLSPYGKTIVDAAKFYVERNERIKNSRPVDDAITDFFVALKADGLSGRYQSDCKNRLARFRKSFGQRLVADISSSEIGDWLRSLTDESDLPLAALTRNTFWLRLSALINFARERGWCCWRACGRARGACAAPSALLHWPSNGLRHSFASYHAAEFRDAGMLALELTYKLPGERSKSGRHNERRRPDVVDAQIIFALNFLKAHSPCEASHN